VARVAYCRFRLLRARLACRRARLGGSARLRRGRTRAKRPLVLLATLLASHGPLLCALVTRKLIAVLRRRARLLLPTPLRGSSTSTRPGHACPALIRGTTRNSVTHPVLRSDDAEGEIVERPYAAEVLGTVCQRVRVAVRREDPRVERLHERHTLSAAVRPDDHTGHTPVTRDEYVIDAAIPLAVSQMHAVVHELRELELHAGLHVLLLLSELLLLPELLLLTRLLSELLLTGLLLGELLLVALLCLSLTITVTLVGAVLFELILMNRQEHVLRGGAHDCLVPWDAVVITTQTQEATGAHDNGVHLAARTYGDVAHVADVTPGDVAHVRVEQTIRAHRVLQLAGMHAEHADLRTLLDADLPHRSGLRGHAPTGLHELLLAGLTLELLLLPGLLLHLLPVKLLPRLTKLLLTWLSVELLLAGLALELLLPMELLLGRPELHPRLPELLLAGLEGTRLTVILLARHADLAVLLPPGGAVLLVLPVSGAKAVLLAELAALQFGLLTPLLLRLSARLRSGVGKSGARAQAHECGYGAGGTDSPQIFRHAFLHAFVNR
jgi:hypothetical protein